ncbi:MAG TPA: MMPL family transporter, partial [Egibacteraceae bacterium]|nr:MMPL family transporter [Egibacteraceae bacterium]
MAERLLFTALRHPKAVVGAWLLAAIVLLVTAPSLRDVGTLDTAELLPSTSPSVVAAEASRRAFPEDLGRNSAVVIVRRPGGLLDTDRAWLAQTAERLAAHPLAAATRVLSAAANPAMGTALRSPDGAAELLLVELEGSPFEPETAEAIEQLRQVVRADAPAGVDAAVTGIAALGADQGEAITASIDQTAVITILLILLILWWVYRAPLAVLLPLATIAVAFVVSRSLVAFLAASGFTVAGHAETFMVVLVLGAGTDYTLFLVSRYAEELAQGQPLPDALRRTVRVIAGVIAAAAATVIVGFLSMLTADFGMYRSFGPAIALAIAVTLLVGLTFTPALLALTGKAAFWPSGPVKASRAHAASGRWERVATLVRHRPIEVLLAGAILLLVPSAGLAWLTPSMDLVGDLPPAAQSRQGFEILDQHFPAGALAPVQVVVAHDRPLTDDTAFAALDDLTDRLNEQPGIALARSITQPLGAPLTPDTIGRLTGGGFDPRALGLDPDVVDLTPLLQAIEQPGGLRLTWSLLERYPQFNDLLAPFLSDDRQTTRLIVELDGNPFVPESLGKLDALPHVVADTLSGTSLAGAQVHLAGSPAYYRDVQDVAARDLALITVVLMLGIFLVLAALLRSLVAPIYLLATVLLSYAATLGLTTWMSMLVLGTADMAFWIPPFLLVILVALGADYNIFIMGRIREEVDAGSDIGAATARGLVLTGGVITSAGLILAGTFAVLMLAPMPNLRLIGFAVTVGVLLDTFVVRSVLVPAATVLLDRWALWPSAHPRVRALRLAPATIAGLVVLLLAAAALPSLPAEPVVVAHAAVEQQGAPDRQPPADDPSD